MSGTVVIQSCAPGTRAPVLDQALSSVQAWAENAGYAYRLSHDEIFDLIPDACLKAAGSRTQMAVDVARLAWIQQLLDDGYDRVCWLDADVFVFDAARMNIDVDEGYAFGRERWVQASGKGGLRIYKNVHNALLVFTGAGRATLDFYRDGAERVLLRAGANADVPPQLVGPKMLTALHNIVDFPLLDCVGMASPLVLADLVRGGGAAWRSLVEAHGGHLAAVNLCTSMDGHRVDGVDVSAELMLDAIRNLESI